MLIESYNTLKNRLQINEDNFYDHSTSSANLNTLQTRLKTRGGSNQWIRMREDKLRSLKKALLYSYQSAVVQKYDINNNIKANNIIQLITKIQDKISLTDNDNDFLTKLQQQYSILVSRDDPGYINQLQKIVDNLVNASPLFRCLINHDKLKVDYEDKIISIPFAEAPLGSDQIQDTDFHNGTVFKWVHGNKEEWTPDTYWIVYMQYSEETAYFRAEIRKANEEIEIITIDDQGQESSTTYRGWMTGPNETSALWNTKKGVSWNDLNYTKILYITKDENTVAFFDRFDRVVINGKPWQIQAYNENYSTSKTTGVDTGIIRVALKETYTSSDQFIKQTLQEKARQKENKIQYDAIHTDPRIDGPTIVRPYDVIEYTAKNFEIERDQQGKEIPKHWSLYGTSIAKIIFTSVDGLTIKVAVLTGTSNKRGFFVNYGDSESTMLNVVVESL